MMQHTNENNATIINTNRNMGLCNLWNIKPLNLVSNLMIYHNDGKIQINGRKPWWHVSNSFPAQMVWVLLGAFGRHTPGTQVIEHSPEVKRTNDFFSPLKLDSTQVTFGSCHVYCGLCSTCSFYNAIMHCIKCSQLDSSLHSKTLDQSPANQ